MQQVHTDRLVRDLSAITSDVEELVRATSGNANEVVTGARDRIEHSLRTARQNLKSARQCAIEDARNVAQSTDAYLRENIWTVIGVAGGAGLLLGAIVGLNRGSSRRPRD